MVRPEVQIKTKGAEAKTQILRHYYKPELLWQKNQWWCNQDQALNKVNRVGQQATIHRNRKNKDLIRQKRYYTNFFVLKIITL